MDCDVPITVSEAGGRKLASSGSKWEPKMGYSRAVRCGNYIAVTGTVGINVDGTYPQGMEAQARRSLQIICAALAALGGRIEHVVRTRIYVTDATQWEQIAKVHGSIFSQTRPATTLVEVAALVDPEAMVEIEADAIVPEPRT